MKLLDLTLGAAAAAQVGPSAILSASPRNLVIQADLIGPAGGTSIDVYVQTSLDGGLSWCDIANFHLTTAAARRVFNLNGQTPVTTQATPTDGSLAANTAVDGILGPMYRTKWTSVGVYTGGEMRVDIASDQLPNAA